MKLRNLKISFEHGCQGVKIRIKNLNVNRMKGKKRKYCLLTNERIGRSKDSYKLINQFKNLWIGGWDCCMIDLFYSKLEVG